MDFSAPSIPQPIPFCPSGSEAHCRPPPKAARPTTRSPPPRSAFASFALSFLLRALFPPPRSPSSPSAPCFLSHFHPICPQHYRSSTIFPPITTVHPPKSTAPARQPAQRSFLWYRKLETKQPSLFCQRERRKGMGFGEGEGAFLPRSLASPSPKATLFPKIAICSCLFLQEFPFLRQIGNSFSPLRDLRLPFSPEIPLPAPRKATPFPKIAIYSCLFSKNALSPAKRSNSFSQNSDLRLLIAESVPADAPSQAPERKNNNENAVHD